MTKRHSAREYIDLRLLCVGFFGIELDDYLLHFIRIIEIQRQGEEMEDQVPNAGSAWHVFEADEVFRRLDSSPEGLGTAEAEIRLQHHGLNRLPPPAKQSAVVRFLRQFHNVLIYVLMAAAVVTLILAHYVDSAVIFGVVLVNALVGFVQEGKAEAALEGIRKLLSQQAMVKRDGRFISVQADELVPGDVVLLQSGDKVPADLRLFGVHELRVEESMLTGESLPVEKTVALVAENAPIGDRKNLVFSGTLVTYGRAQGVVVATGIVSEIGRISGLLQEVQVLTTPLLRQMATFGKWLTVAIFVVALATFAFGVLVQNYGADEMFLAAVGLAVAGIPEGLPAIMTITLAIGVQRMAKKNAIIRRLPAVETLGSINVICSDKTGTLTCNEMTVRCISSGAGVFDVSGSGYDPHGGFSTNEESIYPEDVPLLGELAQAALLCNDASLDDAHGVWRVNGDPTEGALIALAMKCGLDHAHVQNQFPRTDLIPFESKHRFMATLHHDHAGHSFIYLKGAPERVLDMCLMQRMRGDDVPLDRPFWQTAMEEMAGRGQRLLAIAFKTQDGTKESLTFTDVEGGLTLLGVVGIIDPPREEAIEAVKVCGEAGIRVKMITGDHATTAKAIGSMMGIGDGATVIAGPELDKMSENELQHSISTCDIFARVSPEQKLQLVTAIQARGSVVAMTGDGVNDAPALKRADVGIAMGQKGTEVAKEAAEMVLTDDNFASIARAVEEGRTVYDNIKKSILFVLPTNGGEALTIVAAIAMGRMLPITAAQILWINMVTAVTLALALAFEPAEGDIMRRPPRRASEPMLSRFLVWRIVFVSLILVTGTFGLFVWEREHGATIEVARTTAVNALVMFEILYLFSVRRFWGLALTRAGLMGNPYVWYAIAILLVLQMAFTYLEPMQLLFASAPITWDAWLRIILVASSVVLLVEGEKLLLRKRFSRKAI